MKMYIRIFIKLILCSQLITTSFANASEKSAVVLGDMTKVCGKLTAERHFGPPNFGENPKTDSTFIAWVLMPNHPILFVSKNDSANLLNSDRIQIYFNVEKVTRKSRLNLLKKHICVTGYSAEATSPGDIAPLNISVETIRVK